MDKLGRLENLLTYKKMLFYLVVSNQRWIQGHTVSPIPLLEIFSFFLNTTFLN